MRIDSTDKGQRGIFLFIAELNGYKQGPSVEDKVAFGKACWEQKTLHPFNVTTDKGRKQLSHHIWLERLYAELDSYEEYKLHKGLAEALGTDLPDPHQWSVPIEADASASMLQFVGLLLGDKRLLEMTNVIGTSVRDPWFLEGVTRNAVKSVYTPKIYGSSGTEERLLQDADEPYTEETLYKLRMESKTGAFGLANAFKDFIVQNVKTAEVMYPVVDGERFEVKCNKFKHVGESTVWYDLYNSQDGGIKRLAHTKTVSVPDLDRFKRYWVTGLIHNLDSQVADYVTGKCYDKYKWVLDIHDAYLINPEASEDVRAWYAEALEGIYERRHQILGDYFKSIGITAKATEQWQAVKAMVVPLEEPLKVREIALK